MAQFPEFVVVFPESMEIDRGLYFVGVGVGAGVVGAGVVGAGVGPRIVGAGVVGAGVVDIGPEVSTEATGLFVRLFTMSFIRLLNESNSVLKLFLFKRVPNGKSKICFKKLLILVPVIVLSSWNISRILVIKSSMLTFSLLSFFNSSYILFLNSSSVSVLLSLLFLRFL